MSLLEREKMWIQKASLEQLDNFFYLQIDELESIDSDQSTLDLKKGDTF